MPDYFVLYSYEAMAGTDSSRMLLITFVIMFLVSYDKGFLMSYNYYGDLLGSSYSNLAALSSLGSFETELLSAFGSLTDDS